MSRMERLTSLELKHKFLERVIHNENARHAPDITLLKDLKVRRLRVKEEIGRLLNA